MYDAASKTKFFTIDNLLLGLLTYFILGSIEIFTSVKYLLIFAITCTGWVSLIIIIPLVFFTGYIEKIFLYGIFSAIFEKKDEEKPKSVQSYSADQLALNQYIKRIYSYPGLNKEIITGIKQKGWREDQIDIAIKFATN